jgi:hypothetical protein
MIASAIFFFAVSSPVAVVGGWDDRPTATIAEGYGKQLAPIKAASEKCGFSRTWIWDDNTSGAQLWVLADEVRPIRVQCLRRWKVKATGVNVDWKLSGLNKK